MASLIALSEATSGMPACRPLPRERWPSVCESRMAADLEALRALASERRGAGAVRTGIPGPEGRR